MSEVKWIKIAVNMFDNRKIRQIETMPKGDSILLIWVKLMCLAGSVNDGGSIYLTKDIPYTPEMLATQLNRPVATIKLALKTFVQFGMIEVTDNMIYLPSWEKYQNTGKLTEIREQTRARVARHREKQKQVTNEASNGVVDEECNATSNVTCNVTVTQSNAIDIEEEEDIDKSKIENKRKSVTQKPTRHKYGEYGNVLLSDDDLDKLKAEFPADWENWIRRLSAYIASSGKSYKNHLATIRNWASREPGAKIAAKPAGDMDDLDKFF